MARARNIKPSFFKNEDLAELPFSTRLLFIGLWMLADREGRLEDRPKRIKMEVFPGDDANVEKGLSELHASGFVRRYEVNGSRYIEVCAFLKHQNPHHREPPSIIPKPEALPPLQPPKSPRLEVVVTTPKPGESLGLAPELPGLAVLNPESPILNPESREKALSAAKPPADPIPYERIIDFYHAAMTNLPKVRDRTPARRTLIRSAWEASPSRRSLEFWKAYFEECADSSFLNGTGPYTNGHENWRPSFDYLMRQKTITDVYEKAMDRLERAQA